MNPNQDPDLYSVQPPSATMFSDPEAQQNYSPVSPVAAQQPPEMLVYPHPPKKSRGRALFITTMAVAVVLLVGGGAVFGLYMPNQPNNVYKTGLDRSGMAMDKLVNAGTEQQKITKLQSSELSGDIEVTGPDKIYNGTINMRYDKNQSATTFGYKSSTPGVATVASQDFSAQILSDLAVGKTYPDLYFKITGLAAAGLDSYVPGLSAYDGKWISVTSDYIGSMIPATSDTATADATAKKADLTAADAAALAKIVTTATRDYVLTSDPAKAVLEQKSFKGTEKVENGRSANHYIVGVSKPHAKAYCTALISGVVNADAFKRLPGAPTENLDKVKTDAIASCHKSIDNDLKDSDTFDMWIDKKTKLIHKVRFVDDTDKTMYVEIGQNYSSGNRIPLFVTSHSDKQKYDVRVTLDVDVDSGITTGTVNATDKSTDTWAVKANLTFKPYDADVTITKPINPIPVKTVLDKLGLGSSDATNFSGSGETQAASLPATGSITSKAADIERQTDLRSLQAQLEAYNAQFGSYPTLAEVNSTSWRSVNMKTLSATALADPSASATSNLLAAAARTGQYGYQTSKCNSYGVACQAYTLTTILSTTTAFTLNSTN